jgi:hypothetical protein
MEDIRIELAAELSGQQRADNGSGIAQRLSGQKGPWRTPGETGGLDVDGWLPR